MFSRIYDQKRIVLIFGARYLLSQENDQIGWVFSENTAIFKKIAKGKNIQHLICDFKKKVIFIFSVNGHGIPKIIFNFLGNIAFFKNTVNWENI